jgi:hypothetical protein
VGNGSFVSGLLGFGLIVASIVVMCRIKKKLWSLIGLIAGLVLVIKVDPMILSESIYRLNGFLFGSLGWILYPGDIVGGLLGSLVNVLIGLALIVAGIWGIRRSNNKANRITDTEIDRECQNYVKDLKSRALQKLGIDDDQVKEILPIQFGSYCYEDIPSATQPVRDKIGRDERLRTSNYHSVIFLFSAEQVYRYSLIFSLLEDEELEETDECFYSDVVSVNTVSGTLAPKTSKQSKRLKGVARWIVCGLALLGLWWWGLPPLYFMIVAGLAFIWLWKRKPAKKNKTTFETFRLFTSGPGESKISATISDIDMAAAERSIQGMKNLVRDKKLRRS